MIQEIQRTGGVTGNPAHTHNAVLRGLEKRKITQRLERIAFGRYQAIWVITGYGTAILNALKAKE